MFYFKFPNEKRKLYIFHMIGSGVISNWILEKKFMNQISFINKANEYEI